MNRNNLHLFIFFIFMSWNASSFGMHSPQVLQLAEKYSFMRAPRFGGLFGEKKTHLISIDEESLKSLNLCPLFSKQESFIMDQKMAVQLTQDMRAQGMSEGDIKMQLADLTKAPGPKCHVFIEDGERSRFEEKPVSIDVPCVLPLGSFNNIQRSLIQLKGLDQFKLAEQTSLSPALCAGTSLYNACLLNNYARTGEVKNLSYLQDINHASNFLLDLKIDDWINVEIVKENIARIGQILNIDTSDISAVSTVELFDSALKQKPEFALFNEEEFNYVQAIKQKIQEGLKKLYFAHLIIVGNEEAAESHGHYFAFAIIKSFDKIQYVVIDTLPTVYHLEPGSHERNRLMYLIENLEQGSSDVKFVNMRTYLLRLHGAFGD